jgi:ABC-2 type transport system ATP-binding protein
VLFRGRPLDVAYRQAIRIQVQATALQDFQTVAESLTLFASVSSQIISRVNSHTISGYARPDFPH